MNPKVNRSNEARSYSPKNNWKSSSKWIGSTSVSWLWPLKGGHPKMRDSNQLNLGISMEPTIKKLWMLGLRKWRIIYMLLRLDDIRPWSSPNPIWKAMPPSGGQWDKRKGITMATLGSSLRNALSPNLSQGIPITSRVQTLWPCECHKWQLASICEGLFRTHAWDPTHAWVGSHVLICDGVSNLGQAEAWGELALFTNKGHHESGRLFGCGAGWKIQV